MSHILKAVSVVSLTVSILGCATIGEKMAASNFDHSKYTPPLATIDQVNNYYSLVKSVDDQVVSDEMGTYYHKVDGDNFYRVFLNHEDSDALKNLMSSGVGLLEPVFTVTKKHRLILDWEATKKRHDFFTQQVKLKLLPLSTTKEFHQLALNYVREKHSKDMATQSSNLIGMVGSIVTTHLEGFSGDLVTIYNKEFKDKIFSELDIKPDYFIQDSFGDVFYQGHFYLNNDTLKMYQLSEIKFVPSSYYENLIKPGYGRSFSGCSYEMPESYRYFINENKRQSNIPYLSLFIAEAQDAKNRKNKALMTKKSNSLKDFIDNLSINREKQEAACLYGLRNLAVSGVIESKKLD